MKIKAEPKTANCCGSSLQSNLQKVNSTSKYDYGERRYITGNEQTPSSPSGSVCSSTSGKESSSLSPCSKDISPYTIPSESSCTYMNRSGERWDMNYYILYLNRCDKHCVYDVDVFCAQKYLNSFCIVCIMYSAHSFHGAINTLLW